MGCEACRAWVAAVMAAPKPEPAELLPAIAPPPRRVQASPWALAPRPAPELAPEISGILNGLAGGPPPPTLETALSRSIRWERTRCHGPEGRRCKAGDRNPCKRCLDVDFPYRATVDGLQWKLRYNGRHAAAGLVVEGRELGPVKDWPPGWRSFGAPTPERAETEDDGDDNGE